MEGVNDVANIDDIDDIVIPAEIVDPVPPAEPGTPGAADGEIVLGAGEQPAPAFAPREDVLGADKAKLGEIPTEQSNEEEVYLGISDILKGKGFFAGQEEGATIKNATELAAAFDSEVKARLSDRQREIQEYMNQGLPIGKVSKIQTALDEANAITSETITAEPGLAKNLIVSDLLHKGFDQASADKFFTMMESSGEVNTEALKALASRKQNLGGMIQKEVDSAKAAQDAQKAVLQANATKLAEKLNQKEVFGRNLSKIAIDKLNTLANTPVAYTKDGHPLNAVMKFKEDNPIDFEHKLMYLFSATNGFTDLNAFDRSAESRISSKMRSAVTTMASSLPVENAGEQGSFKPKFNIDDIDDIV